MVALDVLLMALMGAVAVRAAETGDTSYVNIIIVLAVVAFTSTVAVSRFVEHRGVA
jgi:multicomponent Na+:H+ antiporter subunit F